MRVGEARPHWVHGLGWDFFWLQSALWLAPLALVLAHGYEDPGESPLDLLVFALTAAVLDRPSVRFVVVGLRYNGLPAAAACRTDALHNRPARNRRSLLRHPAARRTMRCRLRARSA